jgi:hypothetical protein
MEAERLGMKAFFKEAHDFKVKWIVDARNEGFCTK